jgi:hypothetical protein
MVWTGHPTVIVDQAWVARSSDAKKRGRKALVLAAEYDAALILSPGHVLSSLVIHEKSRL